MIGLSPELLDIAKAIGLMDAGGNLDPDWFSGPTDRLETMLSNQTQRAALLDMLDQLVPPIQITGLPEGEKWHPLIGDHPRGNVYLTVKSGPGDEVVLGMAGEFSGAPNPQLSASLRGQLPIVRLSGASVSAVAGTDQGPLEVALRVLLNWSRPAQAIGLIAVSAQIRLAPLGAVGESFHVTLEGLDLDGTGAQDTPLDPAHLNAQAMQLVLGLIREKLRTLAGDANAEIAATAAHLMPMLGLGDDLPAFPFAELLHGPEALQNWLNSLIASGKVSAWLGHVAGLFGATVPVGVLDPQGPWNVHLLEFGPGDASSLDLTLARANGHLRAGLRIGISPAGAAPAARIEADAVLAAIPLGGAGAAAVLPSASVLIRSPGDDAAPLVAAGGPIAVHSLRAGIKWDGANLTPLLELLDVTLDGTHYDRIDLTNTDSVVAAASAAVRNAINNALGNTGPGRHLAALAGLLAPQGDPTWPFFTDPATLVADPTRAIAEVHRRALLGGAHNWSFMLAEVTGLIGIAGAVTGNGSESDPWRVPLAPAGPITLELAAWNAQTSGNAADPQKLRLGLRLSAESGPWRTWWLAEILAFDLPAAGSGQVAMMAGQHAAFTLEPVPTTPAFAGVTLAATSVGIKLDWNPGEPLSLRGTISNLAVTADGTTTNIPTLSFPSAAGFDVTNPAASLGINAAEFETIVRVLVARLAFANGGMPGLAVSVLTGLQSNLPGLPADWPLLHAGAGESIFTDPLRSLRDWFARIAGNVSASGTPFLPIALDWLSALIGNELPKTPERLALDGNSLAGSGAYEDPWAIKLAGTATQPVELLAWFEPAGPPAAWAASVAAAITNAGGFPTLLEAAKRLGSFLPDMPAAFAGIDLTAHASGLNNLAAYLAASDGVVPLASQVPTTPGWRAGTRLTCAHHQQPSDPSALAQVFAQLENWTPAAGPRTVLLVGPAFSDHGIWQSLLAAAEAARPGSTNAAAHFNLRVPRSDPLNIDLREITVAADYYTADLQDDGTGNLISLTAQLERIVNRIRELRPGLTVSIVAHSTAGVAARVFTAAHALLVRGLITLGTPHSGTTLEPLRDPAMSDALRLLDRLTPAMPAGPLTDALAHLRQALDGYLPATAESLLPIPRPYPVGSFAGTTTTETGGVAALALGSLLTGDLFTEFKSALSNLATGAVTPAPTHLSFGLRAHLAVPASGTDQVAVDANIRADAFRIALQEGAADPARPAHSLTVAVQLRRLGGWLVGAPGSYNGLDAPPIDVRVRWAEIDVRIIPGAGGALSVTPHVRLHEVAFHGPTLPKVELGNPLTESLLGAVLHTIAAPTPRPGSPVAALMDALVAIHLAVPDVHGGMGLSADAFAALQVDAQAFLAPRLAAALSSAGGLLGLSGPTSGPWTMPVGAGAFQIYIARTNAEWNIGARTTGTNGVALGEATALSFDASIRVPSFAATLDLSFRLGATTLSYTSAGGQLALAAPPWLDSLTLFPAPDTATLTAAFNQLIPRLLLSSAVSSFFETVLGPEFRIGPLDRFLGESGGTLASSSSLGSSSGGLDATRITVLLKLLANAAGFPPGPGFDLPAGLRLTASGADPVRLRIETTAPLGGVLNLQLDANIDSLRHVTPGGTMSLHVALPGTWGGVTVAFGIAPAGVTLQVTPDADTSATIQLLPTFSGLGALFGAGAALLPAALDELVDSFGGARPAIVSLGLNVAEALDLYDGGVGFAGHTNQLRALTQGNWLAGLSVPVRSAAVTAVANLFTTASSPLHGTIPGVIASTATTVTWTFTPAGLGTGSISVNLGWDTSGPTLTLQATDFKLSDGPLALELTAGYAAGSIQAQAALAFSLQSSLGIAVRPQLAFAFGGAGFTAHLLPLGSGTENALDIRLLPNPDVVIGSDGPLRLAEEFLLPIIADLLVEAAQPRLGDTVWTDGLRVRELLQGAGILDATDNIVPLPPLKGMVIGLLERLATAANISLTSTLNLAFVNQAPSNGGSTRLALRLYGHQDFPAGEMKVDMRFGEPAKGLSGGGLLLYLFDAASFDFQPRLEVIGLGVGLGRTDGQPLINTSFFRTDAIAGYLFFNLNLRPSVALQNFGAGLEIEGFGIPLGAALSSNSGGDNPVAASLLQSDGGNARGDTHPVNPAVDVFVAYRNGAFQIKLQQQDGAIWIGVHRSFGPMYIDQVGLEVVEAQSAVKLLVDGSVKVNGLNVQADDLSLSIPLRTLASPATWGLDLRGLAVGYQSSDVSIAGGLVKNPGPPVQYDGLLSVDVAGKSFTAVGSYARPGDEHGEFTSLFIFVSLPLVLGGPPFFFVTGLGGGAGYNRRLLVPENPKDVPNFLLVSAIDDPSFANDPMAALRQMASAIPARRGSFWLAAGVRFDSFVLVHSVAVVYVSVDRGLEIGVLGISRLALPTEDFAIVSVELALKARFSTAEGILSVQAQLTDNSYLFHRSCRLTGGFAFFVWFPQGQFLLTIGGYHPAFQKRPEYPDVPRLGFHWQVSGAVVIKGEAYFALTNSCVMAGGRLEASCHFGPLHAWFIAFADFLVSWDPFHYDIHIGVSIGISVTLRICFFFCVRIHFELSIGASVHLLGPPLHGEVTIDWFVISITVPFGDDGPPKPNLISDFNVFKQKYLTPGDPNDKAVGVRFTSGVLPAEPPGAQPTPGTREDPWHVSVEFSFATETRMPASSYTTFVDAGPHILDTGDLDLAAMGITDVISGHEVHIFRDADNTAVAVNPENWVVGDERQLFPEATWHYQEQPEAASNTISALAGLTIKGVAVLHGKSALIPIIGMVDDLPERAKPLPFATLNPVRVDTLQTFGAFADVMLQATSGASTPGMLKGAEQVLTAGGQMAQLRAEAGIPAGGISELARHSLRRYRSAPPLIAPLATGLTLQPLALDPPPVITRPAEVAPVTLKQARLRAVLQGRPQPAIDAPPSIHTSIRKLEMPAAPRMRAPQLADVTGARLHRIAAPGAPRPTEAAISTRSLHNSSMGLLTAPAHLAAFEQASEDLSGKGVTLPAGATHVWELPAPNEQSHFILSGDAVARVVFLNRAGYVISDVEMFAGRQREIPVPPKSASVVFSCLGKLPKGLNDPEPGFASVSFIAAPAGGLAAVGWEAGNYREQVSGLTLLGRGAAIVLPRVTTTAHRTQATSLAMIRVTSAVRDQNGLETWLPVATSLVMIILEGQDPTAAAAGDLALAVDGAKFSGAPIPVGGGRRRALLYEVIEHEPAAERIAVSIASQSGWRVTGVVGLKGRAVEWATRMHGALPERIVPDGPLTPDGQVRVRLNRTREIG
jgi:hypothetical protein